MTPAILCLAALYPQRPTTLSLDLSSMDSSVVIKTPADLNALANGKWYATAPVPDSSFGRMMNASASRIQTLLDEISQSNPEASTPEARLHRFLKIAGDAQLAERLELNPIRPMLRNIDRIQDRKQLARLCGRLLVAGVDAPIRIRMVSDQFTTGAQVARIELGGQYLWDAKGYSDPDPNGPGVTQRLVYSSVMQRIGTKALAAIYGKAAFDIESELAMTEASDELPKQLSMRQLSQLTPSVDWTEVWAGASVSAPTKVEVRSNAELQKLDRAFANREIWEWKAYLKNQLFIRYCGYLDERSARVIEPAERILYGRAPVRNRNRDVADSAAAILGQEIGYLYAQRVLTPNHIREVRQLTEDMRAAFRSRLTEGWLDEVSRGRAIEKLNRMRFLIGSPDHWTFALDSDFDAGSWPEIYAKTSATRFRREWERQFHPSTTEDWGDAVSTLGASYDPASNTVTIPAGIMQAPFYELDADPALSYGALGSVIAHEITHGFDQTGARFGPDGGESPLLTADAQSEFERRIKLMNARYSSLTNNYGHPINLDLTADENIADVGGLNIAYDAFLLRMKRSEVKDRDGFSPQQRFFLAYAQAFRGKFGEDFERAIINVDPHAPLVIRSWVPASLSPGFYRAFGLPLPEDLPRVW